MSAETDVLNEPAVICLDNVCEGAAVEAFGIELGKVLDNIHDANTSATAKRSITLEVVIVPKEDRTQLNVAFRCKSSLAGIVPATSRMFIGKDEHGNLYALDRDPRQASLFTPPKPREVAKPIEFKAAGATQ